MFIPRKIFIAGRDRQEVLNVTAGLNSEGLLATIDMLGEHSGSEEGVGKALSEYKQLIDDIKNRGLQATISIKLTHLGLELGFGYCFNIIKDIVNYARRSGVGIEFDMEEFKYNENTLEIFTGLSRPDDKNRICLQANLFKSAEDLAVLHEKCFQVRLVKGAYEESSDVALYHDCEITENLISLVSLAILSTVSDKNSNKVSKPRHAIGTHDARIIDWAKNLMEANLLDKKSLEFQFLCGYVGLGRQLQKEGYQVRIYLPYGDDETAFPYILRRLKNPHSWRLFFNWLFFN